MASSEIEVVSTTEANTHQTQNDNQVAIVDVFSAAAYGDYDKLTRFVQQDASSLTRPDHNGYYALQWAALNNFADIVQYILEVL